MLGSLYNLYAKLFAKPFFIKWNKFLYNLSIRGLGILNYKAEILRGEKYWLEKYLKNINNPIIIDVGANIGNYSMDILKVNKNSEIIAIEPHPITFKKLTNNLNNFKLNIKFYNFAIGNKGGGIGVI